MMRVDSRSAASKSGNAPRARDGIAPNSASPGRTAAEPRAREADGGRAVGGMVREVGEAGAPRLLHADVELVERLLRDARVGQVRRRQVRAKPGEPERGQIGEALEHGRQLPDRDAEAAHTGVDLDVHVDPPSTPRRRGAEPLEVADVVDDGRQALAR